MIFDGDKGLRSCIESYHPRIIDMKQGNGTNGTNGTNLMHELILDHHIDG